MSERLDSLSPTAATSARTSARRPRVGEKLLEFRALDFRCANCYKWRVIPSKEKYEELRESICQEPFVCERAHVAHEWNHVLSCNDTEDMSPNGSMEWAIDMPNIAKPPPGWDREVLHFSIWKNTEVVSRSWENVPEFLKKPITRELNLPFCKLNEELKTEQQLDKLQNHPE
ncbi:hypothetical protein EJB05_56890, partial [Eragrostis curvula]